MPRRKRPPDAVNPRIGIWYCEYPGCTKSGKGYVTRKFCGTTHRVAMFRQGKEEAGYKRTKEGYIHGSVLRAQAALAERRAKKKTKTAVATGG